MTPVGIVGFGGYSGAEAVKILQKHPNCEPVLLEHRADPGSGAKLLRKPAIRRAPAEAASVASEGLKAVLLATPPEVSMDLTPKFLAAGARVIDLSGAFRLQTPEPTSTGTRADHTAPDLFAQAVYGLPGIQPRAATFARQSSFPIPVATPPPPISPSARSSRPES